MELPQAANTSKLTGRSVELTMGLPDRAGDSLLYRRIARVDLVCNVMFAAAAVLGIAGAGVWHAANSHARAPVIHPRPAVVAVTAAPAPVQRSYVHVTNPFDATESFEFPAETEGQAREAMAELLLQRARDRLAEGVSLRHAGIRERSRGEVKEQPEILLTNLDSSPNRL